MLLTNYIWRYIMAKKTERIIVRVDSDLKDVIQEQANTQGRSMSNLVGNVLYEEFKEWLPVKEDEELRSEEDRSYLYGRLVSVYEEYERQLRQEMEIITIAEKNWQKITYRPLVGRKRIETQLEQLKNQQAYFKKSKPELFDYLTELITEISNKIDSLYPNNDDALGAGFIFGYEKQNREFANNKIGYPYYIEVQAKKYE